MNRIPGQGIQFIGIAATIIGTVATGLASEKMMEEEIEEKVNEALARREQDNET